MKRLFISTTNTIDNGKATSYFGVVSSHIVAGTGFLSDFAASLSDFFGGRSGSYRRQLEDLYDEALDEISEKAHRLGANCILGLKIDMDNISGKGMSMFMITAVGTAAKVEFTNEEPLAGTNETITSAVLINEIAKRAILKELNSESAVFPQKNWDPILKYPDNDFVLPLTRRYFEIIPNAKDYFEYAETFKKNYAQFIQMVDRPLLIDAVYEGLLNGSSFAWARELIKEHYLFDSKAIMKLIESGYANQAIAVLECEQPSYTDRDLHDMEAVIDALEHLPDVGKIEVVKGGMFSKDGEKFICRHGHKNSPDAEFCSDCAENIKGLNRNELGIIESFKNRVVVLRDLLNTHSS